MASSCPDEGLPANEGGDHRAAPPSAPRAATAARRTPKPVPNSATGRPHYAELRFAVHCQSRSIPIPRAALDDKESSGWTHDASAKSAQDSSAREHGGTEGESWDEMIARFDDTWT